MPKTINRKPTAHAAIIDLGDALVQTKGSDMLGFPDTLTGQRFRMPGLTAD